MGEAKRRGTFEQRKAESVELAEKEHQKRLHEKFTPSHRNKPLSSAAMAFLSLAGIAMAGRYPPTEPTENNHTLARD